MSKLDINTNNAISDIDPNDVGDVIVKLIKIIRDWLK